MSTITDLSLLDGNGFPLPSELPATDGYGRRMPSDIVELTSADLDALPEYSISVPTGVVLGKRWKANANWGPAHAAGGPLWIMGEYRDIEDDMGVVGIYWRRVVIR